MEMGTHEIVMRDFIAGLSQGNADAVRWAFVPDGQAVAIGTSVWSGTRDVDAVCEVARILTVFAPGGLNLEIVSVTAAGDRVVAEVEGNAILANGVPYRNQYAFVATFRDGKIALLKEYFCTKMVDELLVPLAAVSVNAGA